MRPSSLKPCSSEIPTFRLCVPVTYDTEKRWALRPVRACGAVSVLVAPYR